MSRTILPALVAALAIAMPGHAVEMRGRVDTQASGYATPRPNTSVALVDCNSPNQPIQSTVTDPNGMYFFIQVPAGSYCISIPSFNMFPVAVPEQPGFDVPPIVMPN